MSYQFTPAQLEAIRAYQVAENYAAAYDVMAEATGRIDDPDVEMVHTWLLGAAAINRGEGPFAALVFSYTQQQAALRGITLSRADLLAASDRIADLIITEVIDKRLVPTFDFIRKADADGAKTIYDGMPDDAAALYASAWSGVFLITPFDFDETGRLLNKGEASVARMKRSAIRDDRRHYHPGFRKLHPGYAGYDPVTGQGELTDRWLADRAEFLWAKSHAQEENGASVPGLHRTLYDQKGEAGSAQHVWVMGKDPASPSLPVTIVAFGDDQAADDISGDTENDRLYGMGGDNLLDGGAGSDVLPKWFGIPRRKPRWRRPRGHHGRSGPAALRDTAT